MTEAQGLEQPARPVSVLGSDLQTSVCGLTCPSEAVVALGQTKLKKNE